MNIFLQHKIESGRTYQEIADKLSPKVSRGTACKFIQDPARCGRSTIVRVAAVLGMDDKEAFEAWKSMKTEAVKQKVESIKYDRPIR